MCEQAAAMYVAASELADESATFGARHYFLGVRDAFELVFRFRANVDASQDAMTVACQTLGDMPDHAAYAILQDIKSTMKRRRGSTTEDEFQSAS